MSRLLVFSLTRLSEMRQKGNLEYVTHYGRAFDEVLFVYLHGKEAERELNLGNVHLISVGNRGTIICDAIMAPIRLLRVAARFRPTHYLTADQVLSWWTALLLRVVMRARITLMPVSIPEELYRVSGGSMSGLPIWFERKLLRLSYRSASSVIVSRNAETAVAWLRSEPLTAKKLRVVSGTVEEYPAPSLLDHLLTKAGPKLKLGDPPRLLYVGRLHREKLVGHLLDVLQVLISRGVSAHLFIAGDGPELTKLQTRASSLGISENVRWCGFLGPSGLAELYNSADVFVSTLTGTSLREAGLSWLPIVGYRVDWVKDLSANEHTALLVEPGDIPGFAAALERIVSSSELREKLARGFGEIAHARWSYEALDIGLIEAFGD